MSNRPKWRFLGAFYPIIFIPRGKAKLKEAWKRLRTMGNEMEKPKEKGGLKAKGVGRVEMEGTF